MNSGGKYVQEFHLAGLCVDRGGTLDTVQVQWGTKQLKQVGALFPAGVSGWEAVWKEWGTPPRKKPRQVDRANVATLWPPAPR